MEASTRSASPSRHRRACTAAALLLALGPAAMPARALQAGAGCNLDWIPTFGLPPDPNAPLSALACFDGGSGPELYAGGLLVFGTLPGGYLARWNGTEWSEVGGGLDGSVLAMTVGDIGDGPALFVSGSFTTAGGAPIARLARWNGTGWSSLGTNPSRPYALVVHDDGSGPALFAAGGFTDMDGVPANEIAKWNGTSWSALGSGLSATAYALAVHDDGSGPALYAGGDFSMAGGSPAARVARWNGTSWSAVGTLTGSVRSLVSFDPGSGSQLFASGTISSNIRAWNGTSWSSVGAFDAIVSDLGVYDDGATRHLVASGLFTHVGAQPIASPAAWNGTSWSTLGAAITGVSCFQACDLGTGPRLFVGGVFGLAGGVAAARIAEWDGTAWSSPYSPGISAPVQALAVFDDGTGGALYAGGQFRTVDDVVANFVGRWNGTGWSAMAGGFNFPVTALCVHDEVGGPALYAGGSFTTAGGVPAPRVARWDGAVWSAVGLWPGGSVLALESHDDGSGPALYAGTEFAPAPQGVVRWDGATWSQVGPGMSGFVRDLCVFDDGGGAELIAAGGFALAGGVHGEQVASWNGSAWRLLGTSGMNFVIECVASYDDGTGPALYAAGEFTVAGGVLANKVAKWNGSAWSPLGSGIGGLTVSAMAVFDDGSGPALHFGGLFTSAGGAPAVGGAKWNGTQWSALGAGLGQRIEAFAVFDDGGCFGPALYAGGRFQNAAGGRDSYLTRWGCTTPPASAPCTGSFCSGDGADPVVTTACPCANYGASGHGCANSVVADGALLVASGPFDPDQAVLAGSGMPATVACIYLQGDLFSDASFGDGVRCAGGALLRLRTKTNSGGASRFPDSTDTITLSQRGGVTPGSGVLRSYQTYYRNASATFCPPETFNVTNGWKIVW